MYEYFVWFDEFNKVIILIILQEVIHVIFGLVSFHLLLDLHYSCTSNQADDEVAHMLVSLMPRRVLHVHCRIFTL